MNDRLFGERRGIGEVEDVFILLAQPRRAVQERAHGARPGFAQMGLAQRAVMAGAADRVERQHHVIALLDRGDARADLGHDAGALVPQYDRQRHAHVAGHDVQVAVTGAVGRHFDLDLPGFGRVDVQILDHEGRIRLVQDRGFHGWVPSSCLAAPGNPCRNRADDRRLADGCPESAGIGLVEAPQLRKGVGSGR